MANENQLPRIFVVSDGRGETCSQLLKAALVQFEGERFRIERRANVRSVRRVEQIVSQAAEREAVIFYTLVGDDTRRPIAAARTASLASRNPKSA